MSEPADILQALRELQTEIRELHVTLLQVHGRNLKWRDTARDVAARVFRGGHFTGPPREPSQQDA